MQGGDDGGGPLSAFYGGRLHPIANSAYDQRVAPAGLHTNDNLVSQQVSDFIAGRLYRNLGSFIQVTGDPSGTTTAFLDASDVRDFQAAWQGGRSGASTPTSDRRRPVEHHPGSSAGRRFPRLCLRAPPVRAAADPHRERVLPISVGGAGAYVFWNDMLYADVTLYKGLPVPFNDGNSATDAVTNVAPYGRLSARATGQHYLMVGTFGMYGQIAPGRQYGIGTDRRRLRLRISVRRRPTLQRRHPGVAEAERERESLFGWPRRTSTITTLLRRTACSSCTTPTAFVSAILTSAARTTATVWFARRPAPSRAARACFPTASSPRRPDFRPRLHPVLRTARRGPATTRPGLHRHPVHRISAPLR